MFVFKIPGWINKELLRINKLEQVPSDVFASLNTRIKAKLSSDPVATVLIAAWNEEVNIIRCLDSLLNNKTSIPFDIIVVNNNSSDRTQEVLDKINVKNYFVEKQGCGPARDYGQRQSTAEYILLADADSIYPEQWIELMYRKLSQPDVVGVYGKYSFINSDRPRWHYVIYEFLQNIIINIRKFKRPYLNAYGLSMGYNRSLGVKEGNLERNIRGDDGRLIFDLMKYGKIKLVSDSKSRVWTSDRTLKRDGTLFVALIKRLLREVARIDKYWTNPVDHDTKNSENEDFSISESIAIIKKKLGL